MEGTVPGTAAGVFLLLLFQLCGLAAARLALPEEGPGARLLLGSVAGSLMLHWFPVLFAFFLGFSPAAHLWAAGLALCCGAVCLCLARRRKHPGFRGLGAVLCRDKFLWAAGALWVFFCLLVWRSFLLEDGRVFSSQATYGDMSMHLGFITSLARQGTFPPEYSILPGFRLSYPFLSDSISASLYLCGASLKLSYFLPMVLAGAQVFFGFYLFACRLLESRKRGAAAWLLFFFNGGLGFLYFLGDKDSFLRIFRDFYQTPTNYVEGNVRWVNTVVDMMLPQRATLFGWAVLFPALYLLWRAFRDGKGRYFLYAGVFAGLLPMIHTHSFVALALFCGGWLHAHMAETVFSARPKAAERMAAAGKAAVAFGLPAMTALQWLLRRKRALDAPGLLWFAAALAGAFLLWMACLLVRMLLDGQGKALARTWLVLLAAACILALPQLCYWTFRQVGQGDFLRGHFGWSVGEDPYWLFYGKNLGLAGLLALAGLLTAKNKRFLAYLPALLLWLLAEFVEFQPNDYDNNKLLYPAYGLLCCAAADFFWNLLEKLRSRGSRAVLAAGALSLCMCSALLTMGREWAARYELFGTGALELVQYVEKHTEPDAVILTDTRHNNEIAALSGRNIVCGSSAYLYFHGLPYGRREYAVREMYEHPREAEQWFRETEVQYVLVSDFEHSSYAVDEEAMQAMFLKVFDDGVRRLYRVPSAETSAPGRKETFP